jgi:murein DD-endopeptidase MepM/ murein hydrolase activator NlpD
MNTGRKYKNIFWVILIALVIIGYFSWRSSISVPNFTSSLNLPSTPESASTTTKEEASLVTFPSKVVQGDPVLVTVLGTTSIESLKFNGTPLKVFTYNSKPRFLIGLDLKMTPGTYPIDLVLTDGEKLHTNLTVGKRIITEEPLGIPDKLGGNTTEGEKNVLTSLVSDTALIAHLPSATEMLWTENFRFPIDPPITITDVYGYSRVTGSSQIAHKGTDFRAAIGTPVYAMNKGKVIFTRALTTYGNTIVIDHGLGLQTIYMHLSEIKVSVGQSVEKGELIALSGDTGYTQGPHLHLTVRINNISIDPMKFMDIFGPEAKL